MKTLYIFSALICMISFHLQSQTLIFGDDFSTYPLGPLHEGHWSSWSGNPGPEDIQVVIENGSQKTGKIGNNQVQDALLLLGDRVGGQYSLNFLLILPVGNTAYFNFQKFEIPGHYGIEVYFNEDGSSAGQGQIYANNHTLISTFTYDANDPLISIEVDMNLEDETMILRENNNEIYSGQNYLEDSWGAMDFYSVSSNTTYYLWGIEFYEDAAAGVDDFAEDVFSVYPNPIKDVLNIQSQAVVDAIVIYDVLGKIVLSQKLSITSPSINTSNLGPGSYLAKVTIGSISKILKIIKQ
ncbi:MAG: hypothetical protein COA40_00855 [Aequorivita sp.]|nr:MAG: hypothetical protein COA40_00855 [Aequorivita sp.]